MVVGAVWWLGTMDSEGTMLMIWLVIRAIILAMVLFIVVTGVLFVLAGGVVIFMGSGLYKLSEGEK